MIASILFNLEFIFKVSDKPRQYDAAKTRQELAAYHFVEAAAALDLSFLNLLLVRKQTPKLKE